MVRNTDEAGRVGGPRHRGGREAGLGRARVLGGSLARASRADYGAGTPGPRAALARGTGRAPEPGAEKQRPRPLIGRSRTKGLPSREGSGHRALAGDPEMFLSRLTGRRGRWSCSRSAGRALRDPGARARLVGTPRRPAPPTGRALTRAGGAHSLKAQSANAGRPLHGGAEIG